MRHIKQTWKIIARTLPCVVCVLCGVIMSPIGCKRQSPQTTESTTTQPSQSADRSTSPAITDSGLIAANNRAVGLMGKFDYEPARVVFQELVNGNRGWIDARINLAIATLNRQREGDDQAALAMLGEILKDDPQNLRAQYCSGLLKLFLESPDEALPHFQLVAQADPKDAYA